LLPLTSALGASLLKALLKARVGQRDRAARVRPWFPNLSSVNPIRFHFSNAFFWLRSLAGGARDSEVPL
jgi:hypothetical protein